MPMLLHILTKPGDALADEIIAKQKAKPDCKLNVVDLTQDEIDYKKLLEQIFAADSVQVW